MTDCRCHTQMFDAFSHRSFQGLRVRLELTGIDATLPSLERLCEIIRVFWDVDGTHAEYQRVVDYCQRPDFQCSVSADTQRAMQLTDAAFTEVIHGIVQQGVTERALPNRPIPLMLFGAQAALVGALRLLWIGCLTGPKDQYLEELTAFTVAGLTRSVPPGRTRKPA